MAVLDYLFCNNHEGMHNVMPKAYVYGTQDEDYLQTGLKYDNDLPGYYMINNGQFSENKIDFGKVDSLICGSKYHKLYNQQNFNFLASPHTHIGKARGYLNWL